MAHIPSLFKMSLDVPAYVRYVWICHISLERQGLVSEVIIFSEMKLIQYYSKKITEISEKS